jgi:hypothetical protein
MKNTLIATSIAILLVACGGRDGASTTITPDDANIDLSKQAKGLVTINTPNGKLRGYNQYASFYGLWEHNDGRTKELRYRGDKTTNIPQSGRATYVGKAVRWDTLKKEEHTNGYSQLEVDFGKRTVNGEIKFSGIRRDITLHEGTLRGAEYAGHASVIGDNSGRYEGALYGANAQETAGQVSFQDDSGLNTAFGGIRQ